MADAGFPLPCSSYKELIKIIQGYGRIAADASLSDVAKLTAIHETSVSGNNRFLLAIGIISGGKKKAITPLGSELSNALQHDLSSEISIKWRAVVEGSDFLQKVIAAVRIRKGMDESSLEIHVAYSAGQPKTPTVATGAATVVNILKAAGLLKEEAGSLVAVLPEPPTIPESVQKSLSFSELPLEGVDSDGTSSSSPKLLTSIRLGAVQLTIDVTVQCTPNELDGLGRKLRKVIKELNEAEKEIEDPPSLSAGDELAEG
jgi:hypothetical protein